MSSIHSHLQTVSSYQEQRVKNLADQLEKLGKGLDGKKYLHLDPHKLEFSSVDKTDKNISLRQLIKEIQSIIQAVKDHKVFNNENIDTARNLRVGLGQLQERAEKHEKSIGKMKKFMLRLIGIDYGKQAEKLGQMKEGLDRDLAPLMQPELRKRTESLEQKAQSLEETVDQKRGKHKILQNLDNAERFKARLGPEGGEQIEHSLLKTEKDLLGAKTELQNVRQDIQDVQSHLQSEPVRQFSEAKMASTWEGIRFQILDLKSGESISLTDEREQTSVVLTKQADGMIAFTMKNAEKGEKHYQPVSPGDTEYIIESLLENKITNDYSIEDLLKRYLQE